MFPIVLVDLCCYILRVVVVTHTGTPNRIVVVRWISVITIAINFNSFSNHTAKLMINFVVLQQLYRCQFDKRREFKGVAKNCSSLCVFEDLSLFYMRKVTLLIFLWRYLTSGKALIIVS